MNIAKEDFREGHKRAITLRVTAKG